MWATHLCCSSAAVQQLHREHTQHTITHAMPMKTHTRE